jgi:hypothetical protein
MFNVFSRSSRARRFVYAAIGLVCGYIIMRCAAAVVCYLCEHNGEEEMFSGWASIMFALAYGVIGAILGKPEMPQRRAPLHKKPGADGQSYIRAE